MFKHWRYSKEMFGRILTFMDQSYTACHSKDLTRRSVSVPECSLFSLPAEMWLGEILENGADETVTFGDSVENLTILLHSKSQ